MSKAGRLSGIALSAKAVACLVKSASEAAGFDPDEYSGHSLRAGLATAAGDQGAGLADLMQQTRHRVMRSTDAVGTPMTCVRLTDADGTESRVRPMIEVQRLAASPMMTVLDLSTTDNFRRRSPGKRTKIIGRFAL